MTGLECALAYAGLGWYVFPLKPGEKQPLTQRGHLEATIDKSVIKRWWTQCPQAGIGLNCERSGLVVIDIDPRNGGETSWSNYVRKHEPAISHSNVIAFTGGGGLHHIYKAPAGASFKQKLADGVDIKHKGYIVLAPSLHPSGKRYEWFGEMDEPRELPHWMLDEMQKPALVHQLSGEPVDDETMQLLGEALEHTSVKELRSEWLAQGMALHSTGRPEALELWDDRSRLTASYDREELEREWSTFKPSKAGGVITYRSIFGEAAEAGWKNPATGRWSDDAESVFGEFVEEKKPRRYAPKITDWEDMEDNILTPELIEDLLPAKGLALMYGASGVGKTFLTQYLCMVLASGVDFFSQRTRECNVAYVAAESPESVHRRFMAARKQMGIDAKNLYTLHQHLVLTDPESVEAVIESMAGHKPPGLVVIDTLAAAWAGVDENSPDGMGQVIKVMTKVRDALDAAVLVIHHSGKDSTLGARGHSSLRAAVDTEFEVKQLGDQISARVSKNRSGQVGQTMFGTLRNLPLGPNYWGRDIHTAILVPDTDQDAASKAFQVSDAGPKSAQQKLLLNGLRERWNDNGGKPLDASVADEIGMDQFPQSATAKNTVEGMTRAAVKRALEGLIAGGWINRNGAQLTAGMGQ